MREKDVVFWNFMIFGLVFNGYVMDVIYIYKMMKEVNIKFNDVIFVGFLIVCIYVGLVDFGFEFFYSMCFYYGILF